MDNIRIQIGNIECKEKINKVQIGMKYNTITQCDIDISYDGKREEMLRVLQDKQIKIFDNTMNDARCIFVGLIEAYEFRKTKVEQLIRIHAVSYANNLTRKVISKSFQNVNLTYQNVIEQSLKAYGAGDFQFMVEDQPTGMPFIQHEESAWEFAKRMASHLSTVLYDQPYEENPFFEVGSSKKDGNDSLLGQEIEVGIDEQYFMQGGSASGLVRADFQYHLLEGQDDIRLGSRILYQNKDMVVYEKNIVFEKQVWKYQYKLGHPAIEKGNVLYNEFFIGMSLPATVIAVDQEYVKVRFDFDETQNEDEAYPYPWAPFSGNVFYCPPQVNTKVRLYIDSNNEIKAVATNCIRTNGNECQVFENYENRQLQTDYGKNMLMNEDSLSFQNMVEEEALKKVSIEKELFDIKSDKSINIIALGGIEVACESYSMSSVTGMNLVQTGEDPLGNEEVEGNSAINIEDGLINCDAENSDIVGTEPGKENPYFNDNPEESSRWVVFGLSLAKALIAGTIAVCCVGFIGLTGGAAVAAFVAIGVTMVSMVAIDTFKGESRSFDSYLINAVISATTGALGKAVKIGKIAGRIGFNLILDVGGQALTDVLEIEMDCNDSISWSDLGSDLGWSAVTSIVFSGADEFFTCLKDSRKIVKDVGDSQLDEVTGMITNAVADSSDRDLNAALGVLRQSASYAERPDLYKDLRKLYQLGDDATFQEVRNAVMADKNVLLREIGVELEEDQIEALLQQIATESMKQSFNDAIGIARDSNASKEEEENTVVMYYDPYIVGQRMKG